MESITAMMMASSSPALTASALSSCRTCTPQLTTSSHFFSLRVSKSEKRRLNAIVSQAKAEDVDSIGGLGIGAVAGGLVANPVVLWSLYTLKTTGCGLPPGPGGAVGALEGVSYLVILGVVGWSIFTKVKSGSGLPNGPFGLLGAVEGFSYLTVVAIAVVFGLQALDHGFLPGPLPGEECFG